MIAAATSSTIDMDTMWALTEPAGQVTRFIIAIAPKGARTLPSVMK